MLFLIRFIINLFVIFLIAHLIPGFKINNEIDGFIFAVILSTMNAVIRPVLTMLTLPVSIMTLGLFTLVINIFTFFIASEISYGISFDSFSAIFWGGFIVWIVSLITNYFIWKVNMY